VTVLASAAPSLAPIALPSATPAVATAQPTTAQTAPTAGASICLKTNGNSIFPTDKSICAAYTGIRASFNALMVGQYSPANPFARADLFGQAVRYSFHDAGESDIRFSDGMGPDGCLSNTAANKGLLESSSLIQSVMDPIWQQYCDVIGRADFFVLFAKLVLEAATATGSISIPFQYGRRHNVNCIAGANRLPDAQGGLEIYQQVFVTQLGLSLTDGVALLGAHSLGHVHQANSGYGQANAQTDIRINAWVPNPVVFDNSYYNSMINPNWRNRAVPGSTTLNMWTIGNNNIMLNSDMSLGFQISQASTGSCVQCGVPGQLCGTTAGVSSCANPAATTSATFATANSYRTNNQLFLDDFTKAFTKMTSVSYAAGQLTPIDLATC